MTEMFAASREALEHARGTLKTELSSSSDGVVAAQIGSELFSVTTLLDGDRALRVLMADASSPAEERRGLAGLFQGKVSVSTLAVITSAVEQRWSSGRDLVDSIEQLGREALLISADQQGQLATVEDELFRLGRIVDSSTELQNVLTDRNADSARKQQLISTLLYGKVTPVTEALVTQVMGRLKGAPADSFDNLSNLAAVRRQQAVAHVRAAAPISELQRQRLTESLTAVYGRAIAVHVEVDPKLLGGLIVRVGDQVIDGSAAGRLASVRKNIG